MAHQHQLWAAGRLASTFLRTQRHISKLASRPELPKLFVMGDQDQFSSPASLHQTVHRLQLAGSRELTSSAEDQQACRSSVVEVMPGCDHFYVCQRRELALCVLQFSLDQL